MILSKGQKQEICSALGRSWVERKGSSLARNKAPKLLCTFNYVLRSALHGSVVGVDYIVVAAPEVIIKCSQVVDLLDGNVRYTKQRKSRKVLQYFFFFVRLLIVSATFKQLQLDNWITIIASCSTIRWTLEYSLCLVKGPVPSSPVDFVLLEGPRHI